MIKLKDSNITDILPEVFTKEPKTIALGYALQRAMQRLLKYSETTSVYATIDTANDAVLDMLAAELDTQYYDTTLDVETKRCLVKNSLIWHMASGTPAAVEELVAAVFGEGEVKEWFEYGDDPYYFKIITNALMTEGMSDQFTAMLDRVKNARSHIRAIEIHREIEQPYYSGACAHSNVKPAAIIDGYDVDRQATGDILSGVGSHIVTRPVAVRDGFSVEGEEIVAQVYSGTQMASVAKQAAIIDGFREDGAGIQSETQAGAAQAFTTKPPVIREKLTEDASPVQQAITTGTQVDSKYRNIIKEQEE